MTISSTNIRFLRGESDEVLGEMRKLETRRDGRAWFNLVPFVHEEDLEPESGLVKLFSARGPVIPKGTWVPAVDRRGRTRPGSVGLEHPRGRFAVRQLAELGVELPAGFVTKQDHARRGLIFEVDDSVDAAVILEFLMAAAAALADVPVGDRWIGQVSVQT